MRTGLIAYFSALLIMAGMELTWFSFTGEPVYQRTLGAILADKVNYPAAVAFYLIYILGVVIFAIRPGVESGDWRTALVYGAMFGFFAYLTYNATNLSTLKGYSGTVALVDTLWGTAMGAAIAFLTIIVLGV
ncbi:MAG: DUF2177 family protein, partial [Pseudomonadota bacterium]